MRERERGRRSAIKGNKEGRRQWKSDRNETLCLKKRCLKLIRPLSCSLSVIVTQPLFSFSPQLPIVLGIILPSSPSPPPPEPELYKFHYNASRTKRRKTSDGMADKPNKEEHKKKKTTTVCTNNTFSLQWHPLWLRALICFLLLQKERDAAAMSWIFSSRVINCLLHYNILWPVLTYF